MPVDSVQSLLRRAAAGDTLALEGVLLNHHDRLARRIARKLPVTLQSVVSVEDVLQQTYAEVFRRIQTFDPHSDREFFRWLSEIADHRLADARKGEGRAKRGGSRSPLSLDGDSVARLLDVVAGDDETPSRAVAREEAINAVQVGLSLLPDKYRRPVELRYIRGMSVGEVADELDKKPRTVRGLCYRGIQRLRDVLGRSTQFFSRH